MTEPQGNPPPAWERQILEKVALAAIDEQRRARRWRIFFYFLFFAYLLSLPLLLALDSHFKFDGSQLSGSYTALVELEGEIASDAEANADKLAKGLREAFEDDQAKGVILRINSPGGSAVQSAYVNAEIKRLRTKYPDKKLYAVITDMAASGAYYIAVAADKIYAHENSLIGSIGVLMNGFGFTGTLDKLGVERRLLTAGEHKGFLDPFSPLKEPEVAHTKAMLEDIHQNFIAAVKAGRGSRLKDDPQIFSGLIWSGGKARELGLVDEFASAGQVARDVIGAEDVVDFTPKKDYLERLSERLGASAASSLSGLLRAQAVR
jgi:protease-4